MVCYRHRNSNLPPGHLHEFSLIGDQSFGAETLGINKVNGANDPIITAMIVAETNDVTVAGWSVVASGSGLGFSVINGVVTQ